MKGFPHRKGTSYDEQGNGAPCKPLRPANRRRRAAAAVNAPHCNVAADWREMQCKSRLSSRTNNGTGKSCAFRCACQKLTWKKQKQKKVITYRWLVRIDGESNWFRLNTVIDLGLTFWQFFVKTYGLFYIGAPLLALSSGNSRMYRKSADKLLCSTEPITVFDLDIVLFYLRFFF